MGISIVICCYNSSQRLPETLRHLANQKLPAGTYWEIVIVDNGSKDATIETATAEWARLGDKAPLKVISELKQGTGFARVAGIVASSYQLVLFCDDDNWFADNYIALSLEIMQSDPEIGICGGRSVAVFEDNYAPDWFEQYQGVYACGPQLSQDGLLDWKTMALFSAGMTIRREAAMRIIETGYTFLLTGRRANSFKGSGEDSELVVAIRLLGYKAYYTGRLVFQHYMTKGRLNWGYLRKVVYGASLSSAQLYIYSDVTRYLYTKNPRYKPGWFKDIIKAAYGAFLIKVKSPRDLQIVGLKLAGALVSVVSNIPDYKKYEHKIKRLYEQAHKGVRK